MTTTSPRTEPLTAAPLPTADRDERFEEGIRTLRVGSASLRLEERLLMVIGGVLAPLGVLIVVLGWWGAANTPYVFEQLPYLISGGLLGVGLVFLGAFFYFAHWLTQLVKEQRAQSAAVVEALQRLHDRVEQQGLDAARLVPSANGTSPHRAPAEPADAVLVATSRGSMAHRPECIVVAGKHDVRPVGVGEGLAPCKLCDPYGDAPEDG